MCIFQCLNNNKSNAIILIDCSEVSKIRINTIDKSINNAAASIEMEGFHIDEKSKVWCKQLLLNEITMEEYIGKVKQKAGVTA